MTPLLGTQDEAVAFLRAHPLTMLADHPPLPSLVSAVTGESVRGSWWDHPLGNLIFELANALEESGEVLVVKLVAAKLTFVHAALWPYLYRVVGDPKFHAAATCAREGKDRTRTIDGGTRELGAYGTRSPCHRLRVVGIVGRGTRGRDPRFVGACFRGCAGEAAERGDGRTS